MGMVPGDACGFKSGSLVRMFDESLKPVETLELGDRVQKPFEDGYHVVADVSVEPTHLGFDRLYQYMGMRARGWQYVAPFPHTRWVQMRSIGQPLVEPCRAIVVVTLFDGDGMYVDNVVVRTRARASCRRVCVRFHDQQLVKTSDVRA